MSLFTLTIALKGSPSVVQLIYKGRVAALAAKEQLLKHPGPLVRDVGDDFGRSVTLDVAGIAAIIFSDTAEELEGTIELGLGQARAQKRAETRMKADPTLNGQGNIATMPTPILGRVPYQRQ